MLTLVKLWWLLTNPTNLDQPVGIIMLWAVSEFIQTARSMLIRLNEDIRLELLFLSLVVSIWVVPRISFCFQIFIFFLERGHAAARANNWNCGQGTGTIDRWMSPNYGWQAKLTWLRYFDRGLAYKAGQLQNP